LSTKLLDRVTDKLGLTSPVERRAAAAAAQVRGDMIGQVLRAVDDASDGALQRVSRQALDDVVAGRLEMADYQRIVSAAGAASRETSAALREYLEAARDA
jgi:hypothetical protein